MASDPAALLLAGALPVVLVTPPVVLVTPPVVLVTPPVVLDTNIVLDLFLFNDPRCTPLRAALDAQTLQWISTIEMRNELERVLDYTHLQPRMAFYKTSKAQVLAAFDTRAQLHDLAPRCVYTCKDADDQKFIDLAVAHRSLLLSKDKAVLCMRKRLTVLGVFVMQALPSH